MGNFRKNFLKRMLAGFLATGVVLTGIPGIDYSGAASALAAETSTAAEAVSESSGAASVNSVAEAYGLADNIQDGTILHCWCWSFNTIRENMADIAAAGFSTVQTSPANTCNDTHPNMKIMGSDTTGGTDGCWWWHYQPTDWKIGNYQLGTRDDFKAMCEEADKYGINVIVDVIPNHVTPDLDEVSQDLYNAVGGQDNLFHANGFNPIVNWGNRYECTTGEMGGLPDVNTENPDFQEYFLDYLNDLIACGADGFRYDTAKHIGVPSDPTDAKSSNNNFWPVVTGQESVNGTSLSNADQIFNYGEVLQGDNVPETEYAKYMRMTASSYGGKLRSAVKSKNFNVNNISGWEHSTPSKLVTWVESHDTYCNDGESVDLTDTQIRLAWAVIAARKDGTPLFFSRPDGSNGWSNRWGNNVIGEKGNDQFKSKEVTEVNLFRNAMAGKSEYLRNINGSSEILQIDRGTEGTCIINLGGQTDVNTATSMEDGVYTDQVSGRTFTVSGGKISGKLDGEAVAVIYNKTAETLDAQSVTGSNEFTTASLDVRLVAKNVTNAQYTTSEGESGTFENGDVITVGAALEEGESVTVSLKAEGSSGTVEKTAVFTKKAKEAFWQLIDGSYDVYIRQPSGWGSGINCYAYESETSSNAKWPGEAMESLGEGVYAYNLPDGWTEAKVIFNDGTNQYPGAQQPGMDWNEGVSMAYVDGSWTEVEKEPEEEGPVVRTSLKEGSTFDTESETITLTLKNAVSGTYSVDGGPEKAFTDSAEVVIGQGKIAGTDVTVKVTATDGTKTAEDTFVYHKKFNAEKNGGYTDYKTVKEAAEVQPAAASGALTGYYATNPSSQTGSYKTITSAADFNDSMIIAQGTANDDPRIFLGSHEGPVYDTYALYGAWDDENIYIGWQFTNVTDVVDPAQNYPISDNGKPYNGDIPQILAFNLGTGNAGDGLLEDDGYVWGLKVSYETPIDAMMCFSSKSGVGTPALFTADENGDFSYDTCVGFEDAGISFTVEDGFFGTSMNGIKGNGYSGYEPSMLQSGSSDWVDFLKEGHSTSQDTFYTMTIPMDSLGITRTALEENGIGVMHITTFGESGIGSLPMDMTMLDNAKNPYSADSSTSAEKEDEDIITVPLARLGAESTQPSPDPQPKPEEGRMTVNFGADRSAPQEADTELTLRAEADGGSGTYTYQFLIDGKEVQNSGADTCAWKAEPGNHKLEINVTDENGVAVSCSKEYTVEGEAAEDPLEIVSFDADKVSPQTVGTSVKLTAKAEGGTGALKYRFYRVLNGKTTVFRDYSSADTAYCNPAAGDYKIYAEVKDETGKTAVSELAYSWTKKPVAEELKLENIAVSKESPQPQGTSVKLTAETSGGTGTLKYRFSREKDGVVTVFRDYQSQNYAYCNPAAGTYKIYVDVKDEAGNTVRGEISYRWKGAQEGSEIQVKAFRASKESPQPQGTSIRLDVEAEGGEGTLQYRFYRVGNGYTTVFRDYSSNSTAYCNPAAGTYIIFVDIKDADGTIVTKSMLYEWE